ncbi:hypothetical protein [Nannocystis punicea]|uniref:DUF3019 domain-containing protein n=1 Tax=Nannocystis punicea TaxID=2995304 RepID=A0ABY7HHS4_9BACT|nr:hypothetical protein [Nannocystis poenicansa]WAS98857.1 hypothetical protein O0S08_22225 [Nannocystis poenicansa]
MRRILIAASCASFAYGASLSTSHAAQSVAECVQVQPEAAARGMSLRVHNQCDVTVRCELRWSVRCEDDTAETPARPMTLVVRLAPGHTRDLLASGEACGERIWEIADDAWECKETR